jgi:hypothetical protein
MSGVRERKLLDDIDLSFAFAQRKNERKVFLFVDIEDKPT